MKQILRRALLCALAGAAGLYTAAAAVVQPTEARYVADYAQVLSGLEEGDEILYIPSASSDDFFGMPMMGGVVMAGPGM